LFAIVISRDVKGDAWRGSLVIGCRIVEYPYFAVQLIQVFELSARRTRKSRREQSDLSGAWKNPVTRQPDLLNTPLFGFRGLALFLRRSPEALAIAWILPLARIPYAFAEGVE
jgi:hypothetical protein